MKHLIGIPAEKNISGLPPAKIFICNTGLRTGSGRLSSAGLGITIAYIQQLGQTVANFCTRRHRQSSTLSLSLSLSPWLTSYLRHHPQSLPKVLSIH